MPLVPLYEKLYLKNVSTLALSLELTLAYPFGLCDCPSDDSFTFLKVPVIKKSSVPGMPTSGMVWQKISEWIGWDIIRER